MFIRVQWRGPSPPTKDPNSLSGMWTGPKTIKTSLVGFGLVLLALGVIRLCLTTRLWGAALILLAVGTLVAAIGWFAVHIEVPPDDAAYVGGGDREPIVTVSEWQTLRARI